MLYRVENGAEATYPLVVDLDGEGKRAVPRRYYYDTGPAVEIANPYADWPLHYGEHTFGIEDDIARAYWDLYTQRDQAEHLISA